MAMAHRANHPVVAREQRPSPSRMAWHMLLLPLLHASRAERALTGSLHARMQAASPPALPAALPHPGSRHQCPRSCWIIAQARCDHAGSSSRRRKWLALGQSCATWPSAEGCEDASMTPLHCTLPRDRTKPACPSPWMLRRRLIRCHRHTRRLAARIS